ncbi:putative succinate-semialdehyde dehydrogenase [Cyclospora cayetanensis]|uniref:Succinate-semialdehyde dehydrogenase n=1 Tax=Cyclospora cayetanensis TaxID=88456 RepID=A0A1D3DA73_9EIME|nr:putative succinate-semialdehyde dehydrogenase [Cyclospora cayetanensis]
MARGTLLALIRPLKSYEVLSPHCPTLPLMKRHLPVAASGLVAPPTILPSCYTSRRFLPTTGISPSTSPPEVTPAAIGPLFVRDPYEQLPEVEPNGTDTDNSSSTYNSDPCGSQEPYLIVTDPSTGQPIGRTPNLGAPWVRASIAYAAQAQPSWGSASVLARSNLLLRWNAVIEEQKELLAALITAETGKPIPESRQEVMYAASYIRWCAEEARRLNGLTIPSADGSKLQYTVKEPIGVCALITPFNFPLAMLARKAAAALAAGNACTARPSEAAPLSGLALAASAREAGLPAGLFNVVPSCRKGGIIFGQEIAASSSVDLLSFTGSTIVGRQLYRQCAGTVKRILLELGGNAPFVVFEDANIKDAVLGLLAAKLRCAGQACVSANRVYVHRSIFGQFAKHVTKLFSEQEVGSGRKHGVSVGPLISNDAVERVESIIYDAVDNGARLLLGGGRAKNLGDLQYGHFFEITVMDCCNVAPHARVRHEELFAPVVCLYAFDSEDEVAALCNDTEAGLAAYFYTQNVARAHRFARRLKCGMVGVNTGMISSCEVPFGGCKSSGFGREGSVFALDDYTNTKVIAISGH